MKRFGKTRRFPLVMAVIGLLAPVAGARAQCAAPEARATAGLLALRNQMIVVALSCNRQQEYNRLFVLPFRPALQANDRAVTGHFAGNETAKDTFVTDMVNVMSRDASRMGPGFCARGDRILGDISALRSAGQLLNYAAYHDMSPSGMSLCASRGRL